jgi:hypothetical protein
MIAAAGIDQEAEAAEAQPPISWQGKDYLLVLNEKTGLVVEPFALVAVTLQ